MGFFNNWIRPGFKGIGGGAAKGAYYGAGAGMMASMTEDNTFGSSVLGGMAVGAVAGMGMGSRYGRMAQAKFNRNPFVKLGMASGSAIIGSGMNKAASRIPAFGAFGGNKFGKMIMSNTALAAPVWTAGFIGASAISSNRGY